MALLAVSACSTSPDVVTVGADPLGSGPRPSEPPTDDGDDPATTAPVTPNPDTGTLAWSPCAGVAAETAGLECATLVVPLDHAEPDGETIDVAVARADTADEDLRIGSLVFNPGGPGGSGIEFLTNVAAVVPPELTERFDLVSFDPRGVGASTAIDCEVDFDDDVSLLAAGDDAGWEALVADAESRVDSLHRRLPRARTVRRHQQRCTRPRRPA